MTLVAGLATGILPAPPFAAESDRAPAAIDRDARRAELDAIARDIALTEERQGELRREIDALDKDHATINATLIETGEKLQEIERKVDDTEERMLALATNEDELRASLRERRGVLAEVLAALQRMGHHPPPAILVRPEDALASVRSAILLGAVVPDLRGAADRVASDLRQLVSLKNEMERERDRMRADLTALAENRARLEYLRTEKRNLRTASATALAEEKARAAALGEQATSLKDLIARMEKEVAAAAEAKAAADKASAYRKLVARNKPKPTSLGSADRLVPSVAFAEAKGLLPRPVNGSIVTRFGEKDSLGAKALGISLATRQGAEVSSPADGWVVYAGPFRSYGQLLIINAGDGYHVLLAGMERIDVQLGQFVLAGEPVATMASQKLASAGAVTVGVAEPVLYIEFRKEGNSIDPAPWWAAALDEKVGG
jgi:murein hydrolase activator